MGAEGKYDLMLAPYDPDKVRKESTTSEPGSRGLKVKGITTAASDGKSKVCSGVSWCI
jgi:hypothetical protein